MSMQTNLACIREFAPDHSTQTVRGHRALVVQMSRLTQRPLGPETSGTYPLRKSVAKVTDCEWLLLGATRLKPPFRSRPTHIAHHAPSYFFSELSTRRLKINRQILYARRPLSRRHSIGGQGSLVIIVL
jgi:hypothetical protein